MKTRGIIALIIITAVVSVLTTYMALKYKEERLLQNLKVVNAVYQEKVESIDLLPYIKKGQKLLETQEAGFKLKKVQKWRYKDTPPQTKKKKGKVVKVKQEKIYWNEFEVKEFNTLFAVMSQTSKKIETVRLTPSGVESGKFIIELAGTENGFNTPYNVKGPDGEYIVLANKRVAKRDDIFKEEIYTAYSSLLNTRSVRKAGLDYLKRNLELASTELRSQSVKSHAFSGLVADVTPMDVAMVLSVIEHIDPSRMKSVPIGNLINEVLVTVGANQENAYRYAKSSAGARGLFQFIARTYNSINERYPEACLEPDFIRGMDKHINAAKASLLLFDSDLSVMSRDQRTIMAKNLHVMGRYLAAAYNGGAPRANKAMKKHGSNWARKMLPETVAYVNKYDMVRPVLLIKS